ncbi:MAG: amidohydrolase family protein [Anaerolineales bacterium]|nr:amidohydrolase family protein [Anaerolineales bacterium]
MEFDILIRNAIIVDGLGTPAYPGAVGITGARITDIGNLEEQGSEIQASSSIDGTGLVACPGFIDPHSHADLTLGQHPLAENLVMQGITTFVGGNCSLAPAPIANPAYGQALAEMVGVTIEPAWKTFDQWLAWIQQTGVSLNYVPLAGHAPIRLAIMGDDFKRPAMRAEIESMKNLLEDAMQAGARGFSTFGDPGPCEAAALEEILKLVETAAHYGGIYVPHTRHIDSQWVSSDPDEYGYGIFHGPAEDAWVGRYRGYLEAIEISRRAGIPLHIAHLAPAFIIPQPHPSYLDESAALATLEIIDQALNKGIDVTFDTIPCSSSIASERLLLDEFRPFIGANSPPVEALFQSEGFRSRIKQRRDAGRLKLGMVHTKADPYWFDCFKISRCTYSTVETLTVGEIATGRKRDPLDILFDLLADDPTTTWFQFIDKRLMPAAVRILLQHPAAMPGSDMIVFPPEQEAGSKTPAKVFGAQPPAIAFGLFADYLETYVRKEKVFGLEEAMRKATSLPAGRFNIRDRGKLVPGAFADLVLFDPERIKMAGDYQQPAQPPDGIELVLVNGRVTYQQQTHTGARPGRVLR